MLGSKVNFTHAGFNSSILRASRKHNYFHKLAARSNSDAHWKNCCFWKNRHVVNGISRQSSTYLSGRKSSIPSLRVGRVYRTDMDNEMPWTNSCFNISLPPTNINDWNDSSLIRNAVPLIFSVLTMIYNAHSMLINLLVWTQSQLLY